MVGWYIYRGDRRCISNSLTIPFFPIEINGYKVGVSPQLTANNYVFGNFDDLLVGMFGGLDIVVDPFSNSTSGTVRIVALQSIDTAVRHAVSFCAAS